jgi:hypothetical protein
MAAPFGGHPTFGDYLRWALEQGCAVRSGYAVGPGGQTHSQTIIVSPDESRWVIEAGTDQDEFLTPTTIARLDRRLGVKSPWFSLPHPDEKMGG